MGVEAVLQPGQYPGRFAAFAAPVIAAGHPPTGAAQALLDLLATDINHEHGMSC